MFKTTTKFLAGMAAVATAMGAFSLPALADDTGKYLTVTLIGDSYTAGNGAGAYYGPKDSYRSTRNWGHTYVNWLNSQGVHTTVHNLAASGAVTKNVLETQIPALDPTTDLVMLTIGGNDIKFENIVRYCFAGPLSRTDWCEGAMDHAWKTFPTTRNDIVNVLTQIQAKLEPDAQIALVGYPLLSIKTTWKLRPWLWWNPSYPAADKVREFGQYATQEQQKLVDEWNANPNNSVKITFVPTELHFDGHEPDPDTLKSNPFRWLNEFLEDEGIAGPDGRITSKSTGPTDFASWYHPNITGHAEIAKLLQNQIGIPTNVRSVRNPKRDSDIVFVVETSSATADKLDQIKKQIRRVVDEATRTATAAGKEARFSLVSYRDLHAATPGAAPEAAPAPDAAPAPRAVSGFRSVAAAEQTQPAGPKDQATTPANAAETAASGEENTSTAPAEAAPTAAPEANDEGTTAAPSETTDNTPASGATDAATAETADADKADAPASPATPVEAGQAGEAAQAAPETPLEEVMVLSDFTADREAFLAAVDKLTVNGESGGPAVYNALKKAISMPFVAGARKRVMLLGDGELADNDTNNALDWNALVSAAFTANTAEVLVLDPDNDTNPALTNLSRSTGGHVTALETVRPLIVDPPTARISSVDVLAVGEEVTFDGSGSFAAEGSLVKYEWDFDGDGTYDATSQADPGEAANPLQGHRYTAAFTGNAALRVTDKFGRTAVGTVTVTVTRDGDLIEDAQDNCPADRNPEQLDSDKDGIGDVCDPMPHGMPIQPNPPAPNPAPGGDAGTTPAPGGDSASPAPQDKPDSQGSPNKPHTQAPDTAAPKAQSPSDTVKPGDKQDSAPQSTLAKTGASVEVWAGAVALVLAGGVLMARARRH